MYSQDGTDIFQIHPDNNGFMYIDKNWYFANDVYIGSTTTKAWHTGNDGSGSGLDADTLDSYHGSNYIGKNGGSYYQPNTWIDFGGTNTGLYWSGSSSAGHHIYPDGSTYMRFRSGASTSGGLKLQNSGATTYGHVYLSLIHI